MFRKLLQIGGIFALLSLLSTKAIALAINQNKGETVSYSNIEAEVINRGGYCKVSVLALDEISNNGLIKEGTPINIEVALLDHKSLYITGSENIISYWKKNSRGYLMAHGQTLFEKQDGRLCVISNISTSGYKYSRTTINGGWSTSISFPNGKIAVGTLANPLTVAPILSSIFIYRMQGDYSNDYIDSIPSNIGINDFRLKMSGNVESYSRLLKKVLKGETGMQGASLAGYSLDFLELKKQSLINYFLLDSLIIPAIDEGLVDETLRTKEFSDYLRKYILAEMNQDSYYEYGTENNLKATIALQYSKNITPSIQLHQGDYFERFVPRDYLLKEYKRVSEEFENSLEKRASIESPTPNDLTVAVYNLPYELKKWSDLRTGKIGDLYVNENHATALTDIFRLRNENYSYFPTGSYTNRDWEYIGPKPIGLIGKPGDIYYQRDIFSNEVSMYKLIGDWMGEAPPTGKSTKDWEYLPSYATASAVNISPKEALDFAILANQFRGLSGSALSEAILTQSGKIGVDKNNGIIFSTTQIGGLLGYNLIEIAAEAFGLSVKDVTQNQISMVKTALDNLAIDYIYPYGSLNNVKATILNRVALKTMDQALLNEIGTGKEPFIINELIDHNTSITRFNFEGVIKDYIYENYKRNGLLKYIDKYNTNKPNCHVVLYEHQNQRGQKQIVINDTPVLGVFNDKLSSYSIPVGWEVRFYEHENYQGRYWTRTNSGEIPIHDVISSVKILKRPSISDDVIKQELYNGLVKLDAAQAKLAKHFEIVGYDNGEAIEALPITDELFAKSQLFKYGLAADAVNDLWKKYLKKGYLKNIKDARISWANLSREAQYAKRPAQDLWSAHFDSLVTVASEYLATVVDYKLKLLGKEPINGRRLTNPTLRIGFGLEIDEYIDSKYFSGIWHNWIEQPNNWVIYGPDINYSIKTANNIFDFMSFSEIGIGEKLVFHHNQMYGYKLRDLPVYRALNEAKANKFCTKYEWQGPISPVKPGALGLKNVKYQCGVQYITRASDSNSLYNSYMHIISEMMRTKKWELKTVNTDRDTLYMVLQMFIPIWGTVDSFQKGDKLGGVTGLFGDYMFFFGVANGVTSTLKPSLSLSKVPSKLVSKGVGISLKTSDDITSAVVQVNRKAAKISARQVFNAIAKSTFDELNPLSGLGDLATTATNSLSKKFRDISGGYKVTPPSPKIQVSNSPMLIKRGALSDSRFNKSIYDINTLKNISDLEDMVIGISQPNPIMKQLVDSGNYKTAPSLVNVNASSWGPQSGFIPSKAAFSDTYARNYFDNYQHNIDNAISTGIAIEVPLKISNERLVELKKTGHINDFKYDSINDLYRGISSIGEKKFTLYYRKGNNSSWEVFSFNDKGIQAIYVLADPKTKQPFIKAGEIVSIISNSSGSYRNSLLNNHITWEDWRNSVEYNLLSSDYKELYNNKILYDSLLASKTLSEFSKIERFGDVIQNQLGGGRGSALLFNGGRSVLNIEYPIVFSVPRRLLADDGLGKKIGSLKDYFNFDRDDLIVINNANELMEFQQIVVNTQFTGNMSRIWSNRIEPIMAKRAKLSQLYLMAKNEIMSGVDINLGSYKPFYGNKYNAHHINLGSGEYITLDDYVYENPVHSIISLGDGFYIANNSDRVILIDGIYYRSMFDRVTNTHYVYNKKGEKFPLKGNNSGQWWFDDSIDTICQF